MTTSGTYDFAPQIDDLLTEAWERCRLSPAVITGDHARSARRSLQAMLIDWTNRGINLWQVERQVTTAGPGVQTIPAPLGSVDVLEVGITAGGRDLLLAPMSRDEWAAMPSKALSGRPTCFWSERRVDGVMLHLWPVPDISYTLAINRLRMPQDVSSLAQTADAPVLWTEALYAGLASRLAGKYGTDALEAKLSSQADRAYAMAAGENRERVPLTLLPRIR